MFKFPFAVMLLTATVAHAGASFAQPSISRAHEGLMPQAHLAAGPTCKSMSSCEKAVELWCGGYSRADADDDGIPCENVCHSRTAVDEIRARLGC